MEDRPTHGIDEQSTAYRRGLVLGLTMAEVGILIIFVLLLLIGFWDWDQRRLLRGAEVRISRDRMASLAQAEASMVEVRRVLGSEEGSDGEDVQRKLQRMEEESRLHVELRKALKISDSEDPEEIVRLVNALASGSSESALSQLRETSREIKRALDQAKSEGCSDALTKQVEGQSFRIANQEGQLKHYETELAKAGLGKEERPCWVHPDGATEYLYDVVLGSSGIKMREREYPERSAERATLPMPTVDSSEVLQPVEFLERTKPLFESSRAQNCRFFVVVYDATGPTQKALYKDLLQTVEDHFYKWLDHGTAPF
jgi:hypothetical protein